MQQHLRQVERHPYILQLSSKIALPVSASAKENVSNSVKVRRLLDIAFQKCGDVALPKPLDEKDKSQ